MTGPPYDQIPKVIDPPTGWIQNSNDMPWTAVYPMLLDSTKFEKSPLRVPFPTVGFSRMMLIQASPCSY